MEPRISLAGLAKFVTASSSQQRRILRDYKYPKPEGKAQAAYYRDARRAIAALHAEAHGIDWLLAEADALNRTKSGLPPQATTRVESNVQALRRYAKYFPARKLELEGIPALSYSHAGLKVSVVPDLRGFEGRFNRLVKLQFAKTGDPKQNAKIIGQVTLEAAERAGMGLPSSAIRVWDCRTGEDYKLARVGANLRRDIEAACENIEAIWPTI